MGMRCQKFGKGMKTVAEDAKSSDQFGALNRNFLQVP